MSVSDSATMRYRGNLKHDYTRYRGNGATQADLTEEFVAAVIDGLMLLEDLDGIGCLGRTAFETMKTLRDFTGQMLIAEKSEVEAT